MFEKAVRMKLRFPFRGQCSVEDLWDLSVRDLDNLYKGLNRQAKASQEESLLDERSQEDEVLTLQIGIVKHVVAVKLQEQQAHENAALNAARKQKLLAILEEKQDAALREMDAEKLQELINSL